MKIRFFLNLTLALFVMLGCSAAKTPSLESVPMLPKEWGTSVESKAGCPITTGNYWLLPEVATSADNGDWQFSTGHWFDFSLLMRFKKAGTPNQNVDQRSGADFTKILVLRSNVQDGSIKISSPINNSEYFVEHIIRERERDYVCRDGHLVFPEFQIDGGTEGSVLSGRIYRRAAKTITGDLIFYEQIQGQKTIHKYYLYKQYILE
jgi:hypothetical protein